MSKAIYLCRGCGYAPTEDELTQGGHVIRHPYTHPELCGPVDTLRWGLRVRPIFAWYDLWVGLFIDRGKNRVYVFPLPMVGLVISWGFGGPR